MIAGLSVVGLAQKDDQKRPKPPPPVVKPGDKKPPKSEDKPKKSAIEIALLQDSTVNRNL